MQITTNIYNMFSLYCINSRYFTFQHHGNTLRFDLKFVKNRVAPPWSWVQPTSFLSITRCFNL
ncbi:hypothetical protein HanHA300_Chr04g0127581 [Helianthus annuus]|nr:hypothetical protein HanHA300_Chr04g0127581 [Helianthus annuus]KAJ0596237.1 hypothetical protein HanHA89_Chr04g0140511 [Helianthus annuus]KAJ0756898.1 hypothetical protein HanLR1_Chr04g0132351 [Helianthus annuus]